MPTSKHHNPCVDAAPGYVGGPYYRSPDRRVTLYHGNVTNVLYRLPPRSFHCVVTSPPYWGLRDYGVKGQLGSEASPDCGTNGQAQCGRCFVCSMVAVFRGVRRVLRDDGTLWLNLGDSYSSSPAGNSAENRAKWNAASDVTKGRTATPERQRQAGQFDRSKAGIPSGNLVGVPWRVALALQADGWVLRQDVIWHKPSPMPESVRNRCTKAHEYVFLLTKGMRYFYDADAVKESAKDSGWNRQRLKGEDTCQYKRGAGGNTTNGVGGTLSTQTSNKRDVWSLDGDPLAEWLSVNAPELFERYCEEAAAKGDVWRIASKGYKGAHFATFPPALPEVCVKAGTSGWGCCAACGAPWERVTDKTRLKRERPNDFVKRTGEPGTGNVTPNTVAGVRSKTRGWRPTCGCPAGSGPVPCRVLDPFVGSGTTGEVCVGLDREFAGIDLSEKYLTENAVPRIEAAMAKRDG